MARITPTQPPAMLFDPRIVGGIGAALLGRAALETASALPASFHDPAVRSWE